MKLKTIRLLSYKSIARKLGVYFIFYCLIPISFFVLLEIILRVSDYGYPSDFFIKKKIGQQEFYVTNYKFSWRFFPKPMARLSAPLMVPVEKDKNALRIFILGESAAMGDPEPAFSFSRQLGVMLEEKYPDKKIEIYNTAVTAINSNVIVPIVHDCIKLQPDLFVIYMGNNEVIGPYGLSSALTPFFSSRRMIKTQVWLAETRIGQWIKSLMANDEKSNHEWQGMEMFIKNQVRSSSPDLKIIYDHYKDNLTEIVDLATEAGVKVVLSTVVTNERDCAPFISLHKNSLQSSNLKRWEEYYRKGIAFDSVGDHNAALKNYRQAILIDPEHAELNFRIGKCYLSLDSATKAAPYFSKARDNDALRFRCDSELNNIIKKIGQEGASRGIFFVDSEAFVRNSSTSKIPGNDFLYEHVHLNFEGNNLLAQAVLGQTEKALGLSDANQKPNVDIETIKQRLAYTEYDAQRIDEMNLGRISGAPFTNQLTHSVDLNYLQNKIKGRQMKIDSSERVKINQAYEASIREHPADWFLHFNYLKFLFGFEKYNEAAREAEKLFALVPYEYLALINMGTTRLALKDYRTAENYLLKAIDFNPFFTEAYKNMAILYSEEGKFSKRI